MKKTSKTLAVAALFGASALAFGASSAQAFEQQGIKNGNQSLSMFGSISVTSPETGDSSTTGMVGGSIGSVVTDNVEIELGFTLVGNESNGSTTSALFMRPAVKYHFVSSNVTMVPYVGAYGSLGSSESGGFSTSMYGGGVSAGANMFISENVAFYPEAQFEALTVDSSGATSTSTSFNVIAGLRAFF
jgi:hypothetical protein